MGRSFQHAEIAKWWRLARAQGDSSAVREASRDDKVWPVDSGKELVGTGRAALRQLGFIVFHKKLKR